MPAFYINKWYLDYTTPNLDASIIYDGSLRFGPFEYHHSSELKKTGGMIAEQTFWDNKFYKIEQTGKQITCLLNDRIIKWNEMQPPFSVQIFRKEDKYIDWQCVQPLSRVEIITGSSAVPAFGYIDRIETNILPWKFEFDTLLWGRFTSENNSFIWSILDGKFKKRTAYLNSREIGEISLGLDKIEFAGGSINIFGTSILREGNIVTNLIATLPTLEKFLPKTGLPILETKKIGKARLTYNGIQEDGTIIFEEVKWK
jgi:hypothetical protein